MLLAGCLAGASGSGSTSPFRASTKPAPNSTHSSSALSAGKPFTGLSYRDAGNAKVIPAAAPQSRALAGANDLLVAGPIILAASDAGLARSLDGGSSWQPVLTGVQMWSLSAAAGGGFVALGDRPTIGGPGRPVVATSRDGLHWQLERAQVTGGSSTWPFGYGYQIAFGGIGSSAVGVAVPDIVASAAGGPPLRSTDGGRNWVPLSLPQANTGLAMLANGRTLYTTAPGPTSRCNGAVYRSVDAGLSWRLLRGSCQPYPLYAVQFLDANDGFAAGGMPAKFNGAQVVEATSNGGASWQTRWRTPPETGPTSDNEIVRLDMVDELHGWALTGGCVDGENGPCGGNVYVTEDGGVHWYRSAESAVSLVGLGQDRALAGDPRSSTLALSADSGREWQLQSPPSAVTTNTLSGSSGWLFWSTSLGVFRSTDSGLSWASFTPPAMTGQPGDAWYLAPPAGLLGVPQFSSGPDVRASTDDGATWSDVAVGSSSKLSDDVLTGGLGPGGQAAVLVGPMGQCLSREQLQVIEVQPKKPGWRPPLGSTALYTSSDGGRHWRLVNADLPFGVSGVAALVVSGSLVVTIDDCGNLQTSTNGGHTWRSAALGQASFCDVSDYQHEVWLVCAPPPTSRIWVLHSANSGTTWIAYQLPVSTGVDDITPVEYGIVAVGANEATMAAGGSMWSTSDGGQSWFQSWPTLTGEK
jgi:photosystem II stability/assembly factor-like uncharacterized protein